MPGLYVLGLPSQTCCGSALLGLVGADAATVADRMAADIHRSRKQAGPGHREPSTSPA